MNDRDTSTFGPADLKAKLASHLARLIRRHRLDYAAFEAICKAATKETGLRRPARSAAGLYPRLGRAQTVGPEANQEKHPGAVDGLRRSFNVVVLNRCRGLLAFAVARSHRGFTAHGDDSDLHAGPLVCGPVEHVFQRTNCRVELPPKAVRNAGGKCIHTRTGYFHEDSGLGISWQCQ